MRVDSGPNTINRENVQRRIIVQANVAGRDLGGVISDVRHAISARVTLPQGYVIQYSGQFEARVRATRQTTVLSAVMWVRRPVSRRVTRDRLPLGGAPPVVVSEPREIAERLADMGLWP